MDPVTICADTTAGWHESWLASLGLRSERRDSVWRALDAPPFIYWSAVTLARDVEASALSGTTGTVCDSWSRLDLAPFGFARQDRDGIAERSPEPWFLRPAGEVPAAGTPPELVIEVVTTPDQVVEFEAVSVRGFEDETASVEPGTLHPASILADDRMTMAIGRFRGRVVAAAMAYRGSAVGIYGVTTIASARGRGFATALTRRLIDPRSPTVLSPSPEAESLYRRLGFRKVGELRQWRRD